MDAENHAVAVEAAELAALPGIAHGYFTRRGGVSEGIFASLNAGLGSGDERERVMENRARIASRLGVSEIASPYQVHSAIAVVTDRAWSEERPKADGVVTNQEGLAVGVVTADCGPVLFADPKNRVVGAAHAGWQGALNGVLEATLDAMVDAGARREATIAVLGPTISHENYEVGPDFPVMFIDSDAGAGRYFTASERQGHHMFDLPAYIAGRLHSAGVERAVSTGHCTYALEDDFFSFRRTTHRTESDYGRQLSAIALI